MQTDIVKIDEYLPQLSTEQRAKLVKYYETLLYFNNKINLVSSSTAPYAAKHHIADSVLGLEIALKHTPFIHPVYDFGSGNGFPGAVLAILKPEISVTLVERDLRKAEFLKHIAAELGLSNISVYPRPYESLAKEVVSLGVTRALGAIAPLLIHMTSLFRPGATLFHFKSDSWTTELANCPTQIFTKWDIQNIGQYTLPESPIQRFVIASKRIG